MGTMENFLFFVGGTFFGSVLACAVLSAVMLSSWESRIEEAGERAKAVREEADKWGKPNPHRLDFGQTERKEKPWGKED